MGTPAGGVRPAHSPGSSPTAVPPASRSLPPPPRDTARAGLVPSHPGSDPQGQQPHGSRLGWGTRGPRFGGGLWSQQGDTKAQGRGGGRLQGGGSRQGRGRVPAVVLGDIGDNLWQPSAPAAGTSGRGSPQPGPPKPPPGAGTATPQLGPTRPPVMGTGGDGWHRDRAALRPPAKATPSPYPRAGDTGGSLEEGGWGVGGDRGRAEPPRTSPPQPPPRGQGQDTRPGYGGGGGDSG